MFLVKILMKSVSVLVIIIGKVQRKGSKVIDGNVLHHVKSIKPLEEFNTLTVRTENSKFTENNKNLLEIWVKYEISENFRKIYIN